ncbi:type II secretion system protein GspJ [Luteolibacter marinus]|uniref:type II secretion system protein GspJ n=1 Tax=Luteolibacter marinus TaxID=2776705 RepID=UPI0018660126|nr:type II secretion system protein GspJ [Luteolibacter marinus]
MKISRPDAPRGGGFTLLELVLAMLVLALLVGMIFGSATANLELSNAVVRRQNEESEKNAFFELLQQRLGSLPGNARMELVSSDTGTHYLSDLTLQNVPLSFTWGGAEQVAKAIQLSTVKRRDNYLDIVMRYYEDEILEDSDNLDTTGENEPFAEVVLLEDVRTFEWRVLDGRTMEWQYDWDLVGRLPLQMELTIAFGSDGEFIRQIFWIIPKQDPEVMMRQLQQQGGAGGGQALQPGGGDLNVNLPDGGGPGERGGPGGRGGQGNRGGNPDGTRGNRGGQPNLPGRGR